MQERDQNLKQLDRLTASHALHGSESLCKLLRYVTLHAIEHPGAPLKEYQIATEVFGRPADFDPQVDSTIRVQAGRLRVKLAEYYASEGADDSIVIELPKGTYVPTFRHRVGSGTRTNNHAAEPNRQEIIESRGSDRNRVTAILVLAILLSAALIAIAVLLTIPKSATVSHAASGSAAPPAFQTFWKPFVSGSNEPWVIFSNAAFTGRPETGLRYFDPAKDSRDAVFDHYTGVGEVLGVHELDQVFNLLNRPIRVKRGSLFSLDDIKNNDLIFVGSPSENLTLLEIPGTKEFVFQRLTTGQRKGDLAIVNAHPQQGEANEFLASPENRPFTEDYAVIALMKGLNPERSVMILAGTTTFGTQGAVEYVCRQDSVEKLLLRLALADNGESKPFEALLHVKVEHGVPVSTDLVAVHERAQ